MTRLTVKALRHYDQIGILEPTAVDDRSGYRYYTLAQAGRAEAIRYLRSLEMPLETIRDVLDGDEASVREELKRHHDVLVERLADQERMIEYLSRLIERNTVMPYEVEIRDTQEQSVASVTKHTDLRRVSKAIEEGFAEVFGLVTQHGKAPSDTPFIIYHDIIDEDTAGNIEICIPVSDGDGLEGVRTVSGGPAASVTHRGPYAELGPVYHTLIGWMSDHGHESAGPPREVYLNDPTQVPESELLTRVEWPITPEDA